MLRIYYRTNVQTFSPYTMNLSNISAPDSIEVILLLFFFYNVGTWLIC